MAPGMPIAAISDETNESSRTVLWRLGVADVMPPVYNRPSSCHREASKEYVAVLYWGDFWASTLTYLEFDGNVGSLTRLWAILEAKKVEGNQICDAHVLNLKVPLPESVVADLLSAEGESLRSLLTAHLPAPFSNGWKDCNQWVVRNMKQIKLDGQLATLPRVPPDTYKYLSYLETGWDKYPDRLVGFFLKDYLREWPQPGSLWFTLNEAGFSLGYL